MSSVASESRKQATSRPSPPVAEPRLDILRDEGVQIEIDVSQRFPRQIGRVGIEHIFLQLRSQQVLGGEIVDKPGIGIKLGIGGLAPAVHQVIAHGIGETNVAIVEAGRLDTLAAREVETVDYGLAEGGRVMTAMDTLVLFFIHNS